MLRGDRRAAEKELRNKLLLQRSRYEARIDHLKTRGEELEARVGLLATQLRNLKAQNENLSSNLRDMEESTIWRMFGPYRRLRAKISALTRSKSGGAKGGSATRSD